MNLQEILEGREGALSLTRASALLRERMRQEQETYDQVLSKAKAKLVDVIRLVPEQFKLAVRQTASDKEYYYVALRE